MLVPLSARSVTWFKGSWLVLSLLERFSCALNKNTSLFNRVTMLRHVVTVVTIVTCEVEEITVRYWPGPPFLPHSCVGTDPGWLAEERVDRSP